MNKVKKINETTVEIDGKKYALVEEQKKELWEPKGGGWYVAGSGDVVCSDSDTRWRFFGNEFRTEEEAEWASRHMRIHNWFMQLRSDYCPDFEEDWEDEDQNKCELYYNHADKEWEFSDFRRDQTPTTIYFPLKNTRELLRKLNNGEIVIPNFLSLKNEQ